MSELISGRMFYTQTCPNVQPGMECKINMQQWVSLLRLYFGEAFSTYGLLVRRSKLALG